MGEIDLSGLRDIHLMDKPDFWPLAYGWWILFGLILLTFLLGIFLYRMWHNRPDRYAIRKINDFDTLYPDDIPYLKALSVLLKRVAILADGRKKIALLSGDSWQHYLQNRVPDCLTKHEAYQIAFAPYLVKLKSPVRRALLTQHLALWVKKVLKNKKSS